MGISELMGDYSWETSFIYVFLCPVLLIIYSSFLISVPYYLVLVWLRNIEELFCCDQDVTDKVEWAEYCVKIYNKTEEHLGGYFLFYFTLSQFVWIILFYLGISLTISSNGFSTASFMLQSLGFKLHKTRKLEKEYFRSLFICNCLFDISKIPYIQSGQHLQKL